MPSFIIVVYVWQILGRGDLFDPPPTLIREQSRKCPSWKGLSFRFFTVFSPKLIHFRIANVATFTCSSSFESIICILSSIFCLIDCYVKLSQMELLFLHECVDMLDFHKKLIKSSRFLVFLTNFGRIAGKITKNKQPNKFTTL